jgi:hypothetical protein
MQTHERHRIRWVTPAVGVGIGLVYFVAFAMAGQLGYAVYGFVLMALVSAGVLLAARWSETMRGLLDRQDERITAIDLKATAFTGLVMIAAVLAGFVTEVARGGDPLPYVWVGAAGGIAYVAAVVWLRVRG